MKTCIYLGFTSCLDKDGRWSQGQRTGVVLVCMYYFSLVYIVKKRFCNLSISDSDTVNNDRAVTLFTGQLTALGAMCQTLLINALQLRKARESTYPICCIICRDINDVDLPGHILF